MGGPTGSEGFLSEYGAGADVLCGPNAARRSGARETVESCVPLDRDAPQQTEIIP